MADDPRLQRLSSELFLAAAAPPSIPSWAIERMASTLEEQDLHEGDVLFSAGDPPEFIYFMRDGRIRMNLEGGAPLTFEGRWAIGGFDVLMDRPYRRTALALSGSIIQRIPADAWIELLEDSFEIARGMLGNAARTLAKLEEKFGMSPSPGVAALPFMPSAEDPLNLVERLTLLMDMPALRGAGVQTLADLAGMADEVTFEPGEVVMPRGLARDLAYVVFDGKIEASRTAPDIVRTFGPGTLALGAAALGGGSSAWEARAGTRTRALCFRLEDAVDLMEEHFDMVRSVLAALAGERERLLDDVAAQRGGLVLT